MDRCCGSMDSVWSYYSSIIVQNRWTHDVRRTSCHRRAVSLVVACRNLSRARIRTVHATLTEFPRRARLDCSRDYCAARSLTKHRRVCRLRTQLCRQQQWSRFSAQSTLVSASLNTRLVCPFSKVGLSLSLGYKILLSERIRSAMRRLIVLSILLQVFPLGDATQDHILPFLIDQYKEVHQATCVTIATDGSMTDSLTEGMVSHIFTIARLIT